MFVTGPDVVRSVTGEDVDIDRLGGPEPHGRRSGVVHVVAETDAEALDQARRLAALLGDQGKLAEAAEERDLVRAAAGVRPPRLRRAPADRQAARRRRACRTAPPVGAEHRDDLGRLGRPDGRRGGQQPDAARRLPGLRVGEKAARFVRMCDAFGVPLVVLVDVPGYLPGVGPGVGRRGPPRGQAAARLRRGVGAPGDAGHPQGLRRRLHRDELPGARRDPGVRLARRRGRRDGRGRGGPHPAPPHARRGAAGAPARGGAGAGRRARAGRRRPDRAVELGVIDEIIEPSRTRRELARAIAEAPQLRGAHANIPL